MEIMLTFLLSKFVLNQPRFLKFHDSDIEKGKSKSEVNTGGYQDPKHSQAEGNTAFMNHQS